MKYDINKSLPNTPKFDFTEHKYYLKLGSHKISLGLLAIFGPQMDNTGACNLALVFGDSNYPHGIYEAQYRLEKDLCIPEALKFTLNSDHPLLKNENITSDSRKYKKTQSR